jgi:hypothetical protein
MLTIRAKLRKRVAILVIGAGEVIRAYASKSACFSTRSK